MEPIFFEVPIYRCNRAKHSSYMEHLETKYGIRDELKEVAPVSYENLKNHFHGNIWFPWKYNEIIGYLNLYILGSQLRAEEWSIIKKRINAGIIKKTFKYRGKVMERGIPRDKSSQEIFAFVQQSIDQLKKAEYKKRYLDTTTLYLIGAFIDWQLLVSQLNSYSYPEIRKQYLESLE